MKYIFKKENLFIRIAIGFAAGILLGIFAPRFSADIKIVGDVYLMMLKYLVTPVLFCALTTGIINSPYVSSLGRIAIKTVLLYIVMFLASFAVSFGVASLIRPGKRTGFAKDPVYKGEGFGDLDFADVIHNILPHSFADILSPKGILPMLVFALIVSAVILAMGDRAAKAKAFINKLTAVVFGILSFVMELSPIGVASLMAFSIAEYGAGLFMAIGKYIACCWLACIAVFIIVFMLPVRAYVGTDMRTFLSACGKVALMTMSTTSSAATLPTTIRVSIEDLGAPEYISNFTLPLGCTINMCGGACSFCCLAVFVSDFYSIGVSPADLAAMALVATMINMAAPGIPGGGIVLMTSFLTIFNMPLGLLGPIAAFYRLLDMAFTTINVEGDIAANLIIAKSEEKMIQ